MPKRNVATNYTFEQQRQEINLIAADLWDGVLGGASTDFSTVVGWGNHGDEGYLKKDGSVATTAAFTFGNKIIGPSTFTIEPTNVNGTVVIAGNLQVDGTQTAVNSTTMDVTDLNITVAKGAANAAAADTAGITVDGANATLQYEDGSPGTWESSLGFRLDGKNGSAGLSLDLAGSADYLIKESTTDDIVQFGGTGAANFFAHNLSSGNFGIANANPSYKLDVTGTLRATGSALIEGSHSIGDNYSGGGASPELYVRGNGGRAVKIHNPDVGTSCIQLTNATTGEGEDKGFFVQQLSSGDAMFTHIPADKDIIFRTSDGGTIGESHRIDSKGRVLIGATSSASNAKLAVNGGIDNNEAFFELNRLNDPANNQNIGIIDFSQGDAASRNAARLITRRDGGVWGASSLPTRFEFHTCISGSNTAAERLRISSNGNVLPGADNTQNLGSLSNRWANAYTTTTHLGANGSKVVENNLRFQSGGEAYIDHATVGQGITFRTSNSSALDTSAMFVRPDGRLQVYCLNNSSGLELNVGSNAGSLVLDRNGHITSFIRASDGGSNVAGASGGGSRVNLNKEYIQWFTFPTTTNVGDAPQYTERMRLWNGGLAVGKRVGDPGNSTWSNQPVAFQSGRVNPDGASATVHDAQRCNLYVGSNTGWAAGDGGVIGLGGSGTGSANEERLWGYVKGSRQSTNGWEYPGYLEFGTQGWGTNNTEKRQRIWGDGQVEWFPTDSTLMSWKVGGAQRMKFTHTGGGNIEIDNSNGTMTYDTGSDYRLKKDEVAITDALTTVKALKPYQFTYKSDNRLGQGFFAHEAQAVLPDVGIVSGTKDALHTEDDKNEGYKKDDPIYQGIDYSKLVPLLTAALQEATAKIETLETKVAALESA